MDSVLDTAQGISHRQRLAERDALLAQVAALRAKLTARKHEVKQLQAARRIKRSDINLALENVNKENANLANMFQKLRRENERLQSTITHLHGEIGHYKKFVDDHITKVPNAKE